MPKKIVLRIKPSSQPQQEQAPEVDTLPSQTAAEEPVVESDGPKQVAEQQPQPAGEDLEQALQAYDELMKDVERIRNLDKNFMIYCIKSDELRPQLIRSILSRLSEKRNALLDKSAIVLDNLKAVRETIGSEFHEVEEELIWSSIELNTMQLEGDKGSKNVGLKEELEARIPELRKKLASLRNRLKMVEDMIKQLSDLPRTIVDMTTSREEAGKLLEDIKKKLMLTHGPRAEAVARAEIEKIAQQESIPREYATVLLWKQLSGR
ncbi:MAG: hypothetical protein N3H84_05590 [Candidatus Caldarchaeum sp.]|nr:hypothetical protein [Candidatus Caldarchaeum sp.]